MNLKFLHFIEYSNRIKLANIKIKIVKSNDVKCMAYILTLVENKWVGG